MYRSKSLLYHLPMIMIVSGYTLARKSSTENPDQSEWVPTSLRENPRSSSPKESVPDLIIFCHLICYCCFMVFYPHCVHWGVVRCYLVLVQSCDDIGPDLHQAEVFYCLPLGHCCIFDTIIMCQERWRHLVCKVYTATAVQ